MKKQELFNAFQTMFPDYARKVLCFRKIASRTLALTFVDGGDNDSKTVTRVFLYYSPDNWQFGTKLWRKRPENGNISLTVKDKLEMLYEKRDEMMNEIIILEDQLSNGEIKYEEEC